MSTFADAISAIEDYNLLISFTFILQLLIIKQAHLSYYV